MLSVALAHLFSSVYCAASEVRVICTIGESAGREGGDEGGREGGEEERSRGWKRMESKDSNRGVVNMKAC